MLCFLRERSLSTCRAGHRAGQPEACIAAGGDDPPVVAPNNEECLLHISFASPLGVRMPISLRAPDAMQAAVRGQKQDAP